MSFDINQTTDFSINELTIVTKQGNIDVSGIYEEINIYDSILTPCMSGSIVIRDAVGLSTNLLFDGSEFLLINIGKEDDELSIKRAFRIYKQSERKGQNQSSEMYVLNFVSDEFIYSEQQKINQSYTDTYSNIAYKILTDYLDLSSKPNSIGLIEQSLGLRSIAVPNMTPFDALRWLAKKAVDLQSSPNFIFFQNSQGYNFATLSSLFSRPELFKVNFNPKNLAETEYTEMLGARYVKVVSQYDSISSTRSGAYSGSFIGFDTLTRTIEHKNINIADIYQKMRHGNANPNINLAVNKDNKLNSSMNQSRKSLFAFPGSRLKSSYIKDKNASSLTFEDDSQNYIFQRRAIFENLMQKRVKMVLPGNFAISSGLNLHLDMPMKSIQGDSGDNTDEALNGKYLVIGCRHIIKYNRHETLVEVASDSTNKPLTLGSNLSLKQAGDY
jgi:hypothetical protein